MATHRVQPVDLLQFWFEAIEPAAHWRKDPAFDAELKTRFGAAHSAAAAGELAHWRNTPGRTIG